MVIVGFILARNYKKLLKSALSPVIPVPSSKVSRGARESAQPTTAVCGACPFFTKALRMGELVALEVGSPG